ncbi:MAG: hypothetical protein QM752_05785 [Gammaproteobacteria bacterium]
MSDQKKQNPSKPQRETPAKTGTGTFGTFINDVSNLASSVASFLTGSNKTIPQHQTEVGDTERVRSASQMSSSKSEVLPDDMEGGVEGGVKDQKENKPEQSTSPLLNTTQPPSEGNGTTSKPINQEFSVAVPENVNVRFDKEKLALYLWEGDKDFTTDVWKNKFSNEKLKTCQITFANGKKIDLYLDPNLNLQLSVGEGIVKSLKAQKEQKDQKDQQDQKPYFIDHPDYNLVFTSSTQPVLKYHTFAFNKKPVTLTIPDNMQCKIDGQPNTVILYDKEEQLKSLKSSVFYLPRDGQLIIKLPEKLEEMKALQGLGLEKQNISQKDFDEKQRKLQKAKEKGKKKEGDESTLTQTLLPADYKESEKGATLGDSRWQSKILDLKKTGTLTVRGHHFTLDPQTPAPVGQPFDPSKATTQLKTIRLDRDEKGGLKFIEPQQAITLKIPKNASCQIQDNKIYVIPEGRTLEHCASTGKELTVKLQDGSQFHIIGHFASREADTLQPLQKQLKHDSTSFNFNFVDENEPYQLVNISREANELFIIPQRNPMQEAIRLFRKGAVISSGVGFGSGVLIQLLTDDQSLAFITGGSALFICLMISALGACIMKAQVESDARLEAEERARRQRGATPPDDKKSAGSVEPPTTSSAPSSTFTSRLSTTGPSSSDSSQGSSTLGATSSTTAPTKASKLLDDLIDGGYGLGDGENLGKRTILSPTGDVG